MQQPICAPSVVVLLLLSYYSIILNLDWSPAPTGAARRRRCPPPPDRFISDPWCGCLAICRPGAREASSDTGPFASASIRASRPPLPAGPHANTLLVLTPPPGHAPLTPQLELELEAASYTPRGDVRLPGGARTTCCPCPARDGQVRSGGVVDSLAFLPGLLRSTYIL